MNDETDNNKVHEKSEQVAERIRRSFSSNERLAAMIVAFDGGDMREVTRLYDEAMEQRFEDGIEYAKDTVGEWHSEWHRP